MAGPKIRIKLRAYSTISVDLSTLTSDQGRRDRYIRENGLESSIFPMATFVPTQIEGLPTTGEEGSEYNLKVTGDLTVKETTNPVTFDVTVKLDGDTLSGEATTTVLMSDFGLGPISILGILNTQDEVKITLRFVARPTTD